MKILKIIVFLLSIITVWICFKIVYPAHYVNFNETMHPKVIELPETVRPDLEGLETEALVDMIFDYAKTDAEQTRNSLTLIQANGRVYTMFLWFSILQFILTLFALALNKPLLRTRKKPLAEE